MSLNAPVVYVDDASRDPALQYFGEWTHMIYASSEAYNDTLALAVTNNSIITFTFNGTGAEVGGSVNLNQRGLFPISSYSIDGEPPTLFMPVYTQADNVSPYTKFFVTDSLSPGEHILTINVILTTIDSPFLLDYIGYAALPVPVTSNPVSSIPSRITPARLPSRTAEAPSATDTMKGARWTVLRGGIIGSVVGATVLVGIIIGVLLFVRKSRRDGRMYFYEGRRPSEMLKDELATRQSTILARRITPFPQLAPSLMRIKSADIPNPGWVERGARWPFLQPRISAQTIFHADSGVRFNPTFGMSAATSTETILSSLRHEVPPEYSER
ncbi:hypothetical protein NM688_g6164 [Phlebia brevispora]|uniref:Uncharacterized protein n=1 Tax=Phlebia brevispora TaxID=194682 RepID=A0ACC1SJG2_9APHY|nr:hypothetical protein NM688_g6164 [Phlebia brevispora]